MLKNLLAYLNSRIQLDNHFYILLEKIIFYAENHYNFNLTRHISVNTHQIEAQNKFYDYIRL